MVRVERIKAKSEGVRTFKGSKPRKRPNKRTMNAIMEICCSLNKVVLIGGGGCILSLNFTSSRSFASDSFLKNLATVHFVYEHFINY